MSIHDFRNRGISDEGMGFDSSHNEGEKVSEGETTEEPEVMGVGEVADDLMDNQMDAGNGAFSDAEVEKVGPLPKFENTHSQAKRRYRSKSRHASLEFSRKDIGNIISMASENDDSGSISIPNLWGVAQHDRMPSFQKVDSWERNHQYSQSNLHSQQAYHSRRETGNDSIRIHMRNESNYSHFVGAGHSRHDSIYSAVGSDSGDHHSYSFDDLKRRNADLQNQLEDSEKECQYLSDCINDLQDWIREKGYPAVEKLTVMDKEFKSLQEDFETRMNDHDAQLKEKQITIQKLRLEKEQFQKTNQELHDKLNEWHQQQLHDDNETVRNAKGETNEKDEELRRERVRYLNLKEKYTEQTIRMGEMSAMVTKLSHQKKNLSQEINEFHDMRKKVERLEGQISRLKEENKQLGMELEQRNHELSFSDQHSNDRRNRELSFSDQHSNDRRNHELSFSDQHSNDRTMHRTDNSDNQKMLSRGATMPVIRHSHRRNTSSFSDGDRRTFMYQSDSQIHSNENSILSPVRRKANSLLQHDKFIKDITEFNKTGLPQSDQDMSKLFSKQALMEVQRSLKNFVQNDLVELVKEVFSEHPAMTPGRLGIGGATPKSGQFNFANVKDVSKDVFKEETENFVKTLETFEKLCGKIDKEMLNSLSETNTKLVDSLSTSKEWFDSLKSHIETVTSSHMNEVRAAVKKAGINHNDVKFDTKTLGDMIKESTITLLKKNKEMGMELSSMPRKSAGKEEEQRKIESLNEDLKKLTVENKKLNAVVTQAGREKLMAMSRLNEELEKMRTYVRQLKIGLVSQPNVSSRIRVDHLDNESIEYTTSPRTSLVNWAWT